MKQLASRLVTPLRIPLMAGLMLALAASTLVALRHQPTLPQAGYAVAVSTAQASPYGSSSALRYLLF